MSKKIGIVGTRKRDGPDDLKKVEDLFLSIYEEGDWLVSGHCKAGGDRFAEVIAFKYGVPILLFPARWRDYFGNVKPNPESKIIQAKDKFYLDSVYDPKAGFKRNVWIAEESDVLIAVVSPEGRFAGGTGHTLNCFLKVDTEKNVYYI